MFGFTLKHLFVSHSYRTLPLEHTLPLGVDNILHYNDIIMSAMASQITSFSIVYSTFHSDADQRKHPSFASMAFVREIHRWPVNSLHKGPVTRKMFPFDDIIMYNVQGPPLNLIINWSPCWIFMLISYKTPWFTSECNAWYCLLIFCFILYITPISMEHIKHIFILHIMHCTHAISLLNILNTYLYCILCIAPMPYLYWTY